MRLARSTHVRFFALGVAAVLTIPVYAAVAQSRLTSLTATQVWSFDGSESGEPFATPLDLVVLPDGTLWLLDKKDQVIRRYTSSGKPLSPVGRQGSGPGEMANANGMVVARNGTVWVNDNRNARINVYRADGTFDHQIARNQGGYSWRWNAWIDEKTGDVMEDAIGQGKTGWRRIDATGAETGSLPYPSCASGRSTPEAIKAESKNGNMYMSYPFSIGGGQAPTGDDRAWCAAAWGTHVALVKLGAGDTVAVTRIEVPNVAVTRDESNAEVERIEKAIARYTTNNFDRAKIPTVKPGIAALFVDADKRLWVQHASTGTAKQTIFDVHDKAGAHLWRVTVPARIQQRAPMAARGNTLWALTIDEDDVPHVTQFRLR